MKKAKKLLIASLSLLCAMTFGAGAVGCANFMHTHTYSDEWTKSSTHHWHAANCGHSELKADEEEHVFDNSVYVSPTFDTVGYYLYTCEICRYNKRVVSGSVLEHRYATTLSYDDDGHWYACLDAGYEDLKKDWEEHVYSDITYTSPTYDAAGYTTYTCECGHQVVVEGDVALEHNYSSTLTHENGATHWYACTDEGYEHLKKDEATHTFNSSVYTSPTYDTVGYTVYTCECGYSVTVEDADTLEHNYSSTLTHENGATHWYACTDAGYEHLKKDEATHELGDGVYVPPTYESAGYTVYTCECGYTQTVEGEPALEHNYSSTLTHENGETHWYACTDEGYEHLKKDETTHTLTCTLYDSILGTAKYTCACGYEEVLQTSIQTAPMVISTVYVGSELSALSLSGGAGNVAGTFAWRYPSQIVTVSGSYEIVFTPSDTDYAPVVGSVYLSATQLTVNVTVGDGGSASKEGTVNVNYGGDFEVTFTPDSGYSIESVTVDGVAIDVCESYAFSSITRNHAISVTFVQDETQSLPFTLTYVSGTDNAYTYEDDTLTFTTVSAETEYQVSGNFDGNIVIDVGDTYKFNLVMAGFTITCSETNPITVLSGDEVAIKGKNGTQNYIYDTREAIDTTDETLYSAAVYSLVDLELSGKGALTIKSDNNNGVHTKDDLQVKNLTLSVTCEDNALKGNDSVEITDAITTLIATTGDCIKTTNSHINSTTGDQKGTVYIYGGTHNLYAACDGIDAAYDVIIGDSATTYANVNIYTDTYSPYSEEVTANSDSTYYLRYTSANYKYSVKYYNSDTDYVWVNVSDSYETVSSSSSSQGGRPGQSSSSTTYYYYTFAKKTAYSKMAVYMYTSSQTQGQDTSYYACSSYQTVNTSYDTVSITYQSGSLSVSWTNYTTSSTGSQGGNMGGMEEGNSDKGDYSTKAIKAVNNITINSGTINIQAYDDAIHAGDGTMIDAGTAMENGVVPTGNLTINGGTLTLSSHDDGMHAEGALLVTSGVISVTKAYEGVEGNTITVSGGSVSVISSDDGFNSAATSGAGITISGGYVYIYCTGDGIDSNSTTSYGAIVFSGGDVVVICNSGGNSAIDSDGGYKHTGGRVLAIMSSEGMTSESTNGNTQGMTTSSVSLSSGGYLTVSSTVSVKMPCQMSAFVVYVGSSSASISSSTSASGTFDSNGVCWY